MPEITPIPPTRHSDPNSSRVEDFILQKLQKWTQAFLQLDPKDAGFGYVHGLQETPKALPAATLSKYYHFLDYLYLYVFERLFDILEMVYENPRLLMEVSPTNHCTFLHFAVVANAAELVQKLLELIQADKDIASSDEDPTSSINRKDHMFQNMRYLFTVESISGFTAHQMAYVAGNFRIISMIEKCQETMSGICGSIPTSLAASYGIGCRENPREQPEPYLRERIGEVLKSCLETVEFINVPLKIMSLGDEFRLHTSLLIFNGDAIHRWTNLYNDTSNDHSEPGSKLEELLQNTISKLAKESLLDAFLELRDDAGRNILHYLANLSSESFSGRDTFKKTCELIFQTLMNELVELAPTLDMNVTDNIGRTPLHLAAAQGFVKRVDGFVKHKPDMTAKYDMYSFGVDRDGEGDVFIRNITPLVLAATHNHFEVVRSLLNAARSQNIQLLNADCRIVKELRVGQHPFEGSVQVQWSPFQLVAFKGHVQTLGVLLKDDQILDFEKILLSKRGEASGLTTAPTLHLAVLGGKPHAVKVLLNSDKIDPFALDSEGNTALHYVVKHLEVRDVYGPWETMNLFQCYLYDFHKMRMPRNFVGIKACIDLLLQAGLDMDRRNKLGHAPAIGPPIPDNVQEWWYDKVASELQETKTNISAATNAISVTAALVAATSFVGPLQPPLGMSANTNVENMWLLGYSQVNHIAIDIFLFFNSLSFYFAIASIMLALVPSLPTQREGLLVGVKSAQRYLQGAVVLLFASIVFLICTYSAASVVIIPQGRWKYKAVTVSTTIFGGFVCFVVLILFLRRLWRLVRPRR